MEPTGAATNSTGAKIVELVVYSNQNEKIRLKKSPEPETVPRTLQYARCGPSAGYFAPDFPGLAGRPYPPFATLTAHTRPGSAYRCPGIGRIVVFCRPQGPKTVAVGGFVSPPIGNWLAESNPAAPFVFWAIMGLLGAAILTRLPKRSLAADFAD